ncbi:hypothetical protein [Methanogenium organophilum]|uniref:Uncharacterized protein n=1 Tax=Methanogenium organophilum TaxID=2199 RepID=A0A9X9T849_METOG|nr:hypothetical protein [Methanogenium organophilum]WAI01779.1 hypothetical protein OU421_02580 [Methanogenium organophilum]
MKRRHAKIPVTGMRVMSVSGRDLIPPAGVRNEPSATPTSVGIIAESSLTPGKNE